MRHGVLPTVSSLLSMLLTTFQLSDGIVRGMEPGGLMNDAGVLILREFAQAVTRKVE